MALSIVGMWREERLIYLRDRDAQCYGAGAYVLSKLIWDVVPLRVLPPVIFTLITYFHWGVNLRQCVSTQTPATPLGAPGYCLNLTGMEASLLPADFAEAQNNMTAYYEQNGRDPIFLFHFLVVLVLANLGAVTIFFTVSVATSRVATANLICTLVTLYNMLMCGALAQKISMPGVGAEMLFKFAVLNYAYEALMVNEFALVKPQVFALGYAQTDGSAIHLPLQKGRQLIAQQGLCNQTNCMFCDVDDYSKDKVHYDELCDLNFASDLVALLLFPAVFIVASYLILRFRVYERR
jgi:hypothetical protein